MKKDNFFKNSLILTISNSTMGVLRFIFSIILSKVLGPEGIGLYSLIMPIYDLFCCLVCGGLIAAISKETAVYYDRMDYKNLNNSISTCMSFDLIFSIIIALIVFAFAPFISSTVIKDTRALYSIQIICPALIFVALSSIIKGYFYGMSQVTMPAIIDIFEKAIRISVVVLIIKLLNLKGITETVTAVYIALSIGEFISFLLLYIYYKFNKKRFNTSSYKRESRAQLLFNILVVSVPLCINGFLSTAISTASTLIIPRRLVSSGFDYSTSLSMIGKFSGMSLNIVFFPIIVISSMAVVLVPDISQSLSKKDYYGLQSRIQSVLRISLLLGISTMVICTSIPGELGKLFYNRTDLTYYIGFASLSLPFAYTSMTTFSILSGMGKQKTILKNSLITSIEELILLYLLTGIHSINIYGFGISLTITSITSLILNMIEIRKNCYLAISQTRFIVDILTSVLLFLILSIINNIVPNTYLIVKTLLIIILGFSLFFVSTYAFDKSGI